MAEIKERTLKALQALSQMTEPTRPTEIGNAIGEKPLTVGNYLAELLKAGLAETDEDKNLWVITDKGAEYLDNVEKEPLPQEPRHQSQRQ
jgi:predicted transcriptional regulator